MSVLLGDISSYLDDSTFVPIQLDWLVVSHLPSSTEPLTRGPKNGSNVRGFDLGVGGIRRTLTSHDDGLRICLSSYNHVSYVNTKSPLMKDLYY